MTFKILIRRAISLLRSHVSRVISRIKVLYFRAAYPEIELPFCASIDRGAILSATDGGVITVGKNVSFCRHSQVIARGGKITIGDNVHLGSGSIIVSHCSVQIGQNTLIAEYVVVRDQDHSVVSRPIRSAGFHTGAIAIGEDCWLGAKATVLRGSTIGNGAVIGAHSLVRGNVPPNTLAVGCPATVIRKLPDGMKKIAIVLPDLRGGGAERLHVYLANDWVERGYSVEFVLMRGHGELIAPAFAESHHR